MAAGRTARPGDDASVGSPDGPTDRPGAGPDDPPREVTLSGLLTGAAEPGGPPGADPRERPTSSPYARTVPDVRGAGRERGSHAWTGPTVRLALPDGYPTARAAHSAGRTRLRGARRAAVLLVACTLLYGVAVAVLLDRGDRIAFAPPDVPTARPGVPSALTEPARPSGPQPLPAETSPRPVGLSIPAIGVEESTLLPLGLAVDGSMQVPQDYARVGWFTGASTPGTPGPAIIAGHVDSRAGPAVFFRLRELSAGDLVTVRLAGGGRVQYVVDGVEQYPKNDFPTRTVFGPVPGEALRLITCGGDFDHAARSYRDNIVVYATRRDLTN